MRTLMRTGVFKMTTQKTEANLLKKIDMINDVKSIYIWNMNVVKEYGEKQSTEEKSIDVTIHIHTLDQYNDTVLSIIDEFPNTEFSKTFNGQNSIKLKTKNNSVKLNFEIKGLTIEDISKVIGCELKETKQTYTSFTCGVKA